MKAQNRESTIYEYHNYNSHNNHIRLSTKQISNNNQSSLWFVKITDQAIYTQLLLVNETIIGTLN